MVPANPLIFHLFHCHMEANLWFKQIPLRLLVFAFAGSDIDVKSRFCFAWMKINSLGKLVRKTFCFTFMWVTNKEREKANKKTSRIIQISWAAGVCLFWELKTFLWLHCAAFKKIHINRLSGNFPKIKCENYRHDDGKHGKLPVRENILKCFNWKSGFNKNSFHWILMKQGNGKTMFCHDRRWMKIENFI